MIVFECDAFSLSFEDSTKYPRMEAVRVQSHVKGIRSKTFEGEMCRSKARVYCEDKFRDIVHWSTFTGIFYL